MAGFFVGACLVGGLILLDRWQVGEFGLSQPVVACPLLGFAFGQLEAGLAMGAALQLVWVASLPLGRAQSLDHQGAGVTGMACYLLFVRAGAGTEAKALFAGMVMAAIAAFVGAWLDAVNKRANNRLYQAGVRARSATGAVLWHLAGLGTGFARGALLVALFLALALLAAPHLGRLPGFTQREVLAVPLAVGAGVAARMFVTLGRLPWALAGGLAGWTLWMAVKV